MGVALYCSGLAFPQAGTIQISRVFVSMVAQSEPLAPTKRLDSWKEIATFFGRDERTVKRWEKERGLPVYRVPGSARGGVFAYAEELAEWLKAPHGNWEVADAAAAEAPSADEPGDSVAPANVVILKVPAEVPAPALRLVPPPSRLVAARTFLWLVPLVLIAGSFLALSLSHREPRFKNALA